MTFLFVPGSLSAERFTPFSEPLTDDSYQTFLENLTSVKNIYELEIRGLAQGSVENEIWSGSYWPVHKGLLSYRYADSNRPTSLKFSVNYQYFQSNPPGNFLVQARIDQMSPAEKYDLLTGNSDWSLSQYMWKKGLVDYDAGREVATWAGICHGWAAATHQGVKMPLHSVVVPDATNTLQIKFYPHDIKGLVSYLWAESSPNSIRAGNRCRQNEVVKDIYLRPVDPSCLDGNPMSWHLAITNRLGQYKNSFVMDSAWGDEVWNYGVSAYDYSYFNPKTYETLHSLNRAIEPLETLASDRFKTYRSPRAKYIVGIIMDVFHPALVEPNATENTNITYQTNKFYYDLELDENYEIVGGEWYSQDRPDFIWTFPAGSAAQPREDFALSETPWSGTEPVPALYSEKAREASARGKVLNSIVQVLLDQSQK